MDKGKLQKMLSYLPEMLFLLVALWELLENYLRASTINYISLAIIAPLFTLIVSRNKILAVTLSILIVLGSLYMVLAVLSEYHEFPKGSAEGKTLLSTGLTIFFTSAVMGIILPLKYFKTQRTDKDQ